MVRERLSETSRGEQQKYLERGSLVRYAHVKTDSRPPTLLRDHDALIPLPFRSQPSGYENRMVCRKNEPQAGNLMPYGADGGRIRP
jgi:hypothetical protein